MANTDQDDLVQRLQATADMLDGGERLDAVSARAAALAQRQRCERAHEPAANPFAALTAAADALVSAGCSREIEAFAFELVGWVQSVEARLLTRTKTEAPWASQMEAVLQEWAVDGVRGSVVEDDGFWGAAGDERVSAEEREWLRQLANSYHSMPLDDVLRRWRGVQSAAEQTRAQPAPQGPSTTELCTCGGEAEEREVGRVVVRVCKDCNRSWRARCLCRRDGGCLACKWTRFVQPKEKRAPLAQSPWVPDERPSSEPAAEWQPTYKDWLQERDNAVARADERDQYARRVRELEAEVERLKASNARAHEDVIAALDRAWGLTP